MTHWPKLMVVAALAFCSVAQAQDAQDVEKAAQMAGQWLQVADAHQYEATYKAAAPAFRKAVSQPDWERAIAAARTPLGKLTRRTLKSATFHKDVPGAPPGEYVIVVYDSAFANKPAVLETVTPMRDVDGSWKVSGYFVR